MKAEYVLPLRKRLGWTQARLADYLHVYIKTVQNWEHGRSQPIASLEKALDELMMQIERGQTNE
jgi:DNA-binding transcriptional regulator YiaG